MSTYTAVISWNRGSAAFLDNRYSREHTWEFDGGVTVTASSSPHVVPLPYSIEQAVDPEEAFVASLASCHMLSFLYVTARQGFTVDSYRDEASGVLAKNAEGKLAVTKVTLRPAAVFSGDRIPTGEQIVALHHSAHEECFIASSVKTEVRCEPIFK